MNSEVSEMKSDFFYSLFKKPEGSDNSFRISLFDFYFQNRKNALSAAGGLQASVQYRCSRFFPGGGSI